MALDFEKFRAALEAGKYSKDERDWFPKTYARFREFLFECELLPSDVNRDIVILFLQQIKADGTPEWQRLQAVQAIAAYHAEVLQRPIADLESVMTTLSRLASQSRQLGIDAPLSASETAGLVGTIDPDEPAVLQRVRPEARVSGLLRRTELAYVGWIKRFLVEHSQTPAGFSDDSGAALPAEAEIGEFLTSLAVDRDVAPSTQNQAKSALLFLYQNVFGRRIGFCHTL